MTTPRPKKGILLKVTPWKAPPGARSPRWPLGLVFLFPGTGRAEHRSKPGIAQKETYWLRPPLAPFGNPKDGLDFPR